MLDLTVAQSIDEFINRTRFGRTENTARTYRNSLDVFLISLRKRGFDPSTIAVANFTEEWIEAFVSDTKHLAPRTQALYLAVVRNWSKFIEESQHAHVDLQRIYSLTKQNAHRSKSHPRTLPDYHAVSRVVEYAMSLGDHSSSNTNRDLGRLRDRALIVILADTGLDLLNICQLRRGDIDWKNRKIAPRSKNRREAIDLTPRAYSALTDYLKARASHDKAAKLAEASLPLLARHGGKTDKKVAPLSIVAAGRAIAKVVHAALGVEDDGSITVVSFRRYYTGSILQSFVLLHPRIIQRSQVLFENGHYDEAIFNAMKVIEDEVRTRISADPTDVGYKLIADAMGKKPPLITFSLVEAEQESAFALFRGAVGGFKNPRSHRFVETSNPVEAFECLALASLLMRMLDKAS